MRKETWKRMGNVGRENGRLLICTNAERMVNEHGKEEGFRVGPPDTRFTSSCLSIPVFPCVDSGHGVNGIGWDSGLHDCKRDGLGLG